MHTEKKTLTKMTITKTRNASSICTNSPHNFAIGHVILAINCPYSHSTLYHYRITGFVIFQKLFWHQHSVTLSISLAEMPAHDNYLNEKLCETNREKKPHTHTLCWINSVHRYFFLLLQTVYGHVYWYAWTVLNHSHYRDKVSILRPVLGYLHCHLRIQPFHGARETQ